MTEAELQETVRDIAETTGWLYYHTYRSERSPAGFPDLTLVRPPRVVFAELKSEDGILTNDQKLWMLTLGRARPRVEAYVWRPADVNLIAITLSTRYPMQPPSEADRFEDLTTGSPT